MRAGGEERPVEQPLGVTVENVRRAAERLAGRVRRTPLLAAGPFRQALPTPVNLALKLECLQVSGSFKARGALNCILSFPRERLARGVVTASGGNHGLGVAYAGWLLEVPAYVYLPGNTPAAKRRTFARWEAEVRVEGEVWDDAHRAALSRAEADGLVYVHPFADPLVIAGQGTVALEVLEAEPQAELFLVPVGGGGLISGIAVGARGLSPAARVVGVEPEGAPTLRRSLEAGRVVELPEVRTAAHTLAPRATSALNLEIVRRLVEEVVLVTDEELRRAARWLWEEAGVACELSSAAPLAALLSGRVRVRPGERVVAVVSGAGTDGLTLTPAGRFP